MKIKFSKMHGLGNDFVIINNLALQHDFTREQISYLADRKFGIGCDQVLIIDKPSDGISDFYYKIYNSDGSIAGQCGNGARCFIRYVVEHSLTNKIQIQLQTRDRTIQGQALGQDLFAVDMGIPEFNPQQIPLLQSVQDIYSYDVAGEKIEFSAVSMGNPHAVVMLANEHDFEDRERLTQIAVTLQNAEIFPDSVNVNFVYRLNSDTIRMLTYERGCGFTLACGSGACASAAALIKQQVVNNQVRMLMPGGELNIVWHGTNLLMQGSATQVFDGEIEL